MVNTDKKDWLNTVIEKLSNIIKSLGSLVNVGDKTKGNFQAMKEDFVKSVAFRRPDLDVDYDRATGKVIVELNHAGVEARLPFGEYLVEGAHRIGVGVLEGNGQEVLHSSLPSLPPQTPSSD